MFRFNAQVLNYGLWFQSQFDFQFGIILVCLICLVLLSLPLTSALAAMRGKGFLQGRPS